MRRFVHMQHPTFRCSFSVAQPSSAMAQCCTQQFSFKCICIFLHNLFHSCNHISIAPDSSVMRGELSSTRAGWVMIYGSFTWTQKRRRWDQSIALAVANLVSRPLYMLTTYYASQLSTTPQRFRLNFDIYISSGNLTVIPTETRAW